MPEPRVKAKGKKDLMDMSQKDIQMCKEYYKPARTLDQFKVLKLKALQRLLDHLPDRADFDIQYPVYAILVLVDPKAPPVSKLASAMILDFCLPGWRLKARPEILGAVVKRRDPLVAAWRKTVLSADGHKCTNCGSEDKLEAHHIMRWVDHPESRILPENGTTLCAECHLNVTTQQRRRSANNGEKKAR